LPSPVGCEPSQQIAPPLSHCSGSGCGAKPRQQAISLFASLASGELGGQIESHWPSGPGAVPYRQHIEPGADCVPAWQAGAPPPSVPPPYSSLSLGGVDVGVGVGVGGAPPPSDVGLGGFDGVDVDVGVGVGVGVVVGVGW